MENSTTLTINGIQFELDLLDADTLEKFQDLTNMVSQQAGAIQDETGKKEADRMRDLCKLVDKFFDGLFGEGTAGELFSSEANMRERIEAFNEAMKFSQESSQQVQDLFAQYTPQRLNRSQRRAQQFNKAGSKSTASARKRTVVSTVEPETPEIVESEADSMTVEQAKEVLRLAKDKGIELTDGEQA